jgi:hypothetical protein
MNNIDHLFQNQLAQHRLALQLHFDADLLGYFGAIGINYLSFFRQRLEGIGDKGVTQRRQRLVTVLNTPGGEVEAVESMVEMQRHFYQEVYFIIPNAAMSAGTIFCMSGDKVFMDYSSSLGPIDPQLIQKDGRLVPALGYLDKFEEILEKSANGTLTPVEYAIAQNQDLAELRRYEQARDLSVTLLEGWLATYKFKSWTTHRSDPAKFGQPVTDQEKQQRAKEIAKALGDNKRWHSHGRRIGINTLARALRLEIEDYTDNPELRGKINNYHGLVADYLQRQNFPLYIDVNTPN